MHGIHVIVLRFPEIRTEPLTVPYIHQTVGQFRGKVRRSCGLLRFLESFGFNCLQCGKQTVQTGLHCRELLLKRFILGNQGFFALGKDGRE